MYQKTWRSLKEHKTQEKMAKGVVIAYSVFVAISWIYALAQLL